MTKIKKIKILFLIGAISLLFFAPVALAQYKLETGLPNVPGGQLPAGSELPSYIKYLFIFGLGLITILALGVMIFGGIQYILAAGNAAKTEDAKAWIQQALLGLGLLLVSYLLLRTINPDLVNLRNPNLTPKSFNLSVDPRFADPQSVETLNKCLTNKISGECTKLKQKQCQAVVTDQFDPCYCVQNPTAGICSTSIF